MRRLPAFCASVALLGAWAGGSGGATGAAPTATTVGEVAPATFGVSCLGPATLIQEASRPGAPSYDMPSAGVITSFSTRSNSSDKTARLVMFEQLNPTTFRVMAMTEALPTLNGSVNTFSVRVPVDAGWKLGATLAGGCGQLTSGTDDVSVASGTVAPGQVVTASSIGTPARVNIAATLEPDADRDGFGDVSQDACPESAQAVVACPAPDTTITKAPKARSKKRQVTIAFSSTLPHSTFLVVVDGKPARELLSPYQAKLKPGKHTVTVRAVSNLGITDPSPATTTFTIKKPKKHR